MAGTTRSDGRKIRRGSSAAVFVAVALLSLATGCKAGSPVNPTGVARKASVAPSRDVQSAVGTPSRGPSRPAKKWESRGGAIIYSPVVGTNGTVYVVADKGEGGDNELWALTPADGSLEKRVTLAPYARGPVLGDADTLFVSTEERAVLGWKYGLVALASNGTVKWRRDLGAATADPVTLANDPPLPPTIGPDGMVYASFYRRDFHALQQADGTVKWSARTLTIGDSVAASDGTVYVNTADGLRAFGRDGSIKWTFPGAAGADAIELGIDGTVYTADRGHLFAVRASGGQKWNVATQTQSDGGGRPALGRDGTLYIGGDYLRAIRPDGTLKWSLKDGFGQLADMPGAGPPAVASDGTIYVGGPRGLYAITPSGRVKWMFPMPQPSVNWAPVISDGTIYVGDTQGNLYAIGEARR